MPAVADVRPEQASWLGSPLEPVEDLQALIYLARHDLRTRAATLGRLLVDAGVIEPAALRDLPADDEDALVLAMEQRGLLSAGLAEQWLAGVAVRHPAGAAGAFRR